MIVTTKIHVISDLNLGFNEFSTQDEILPDCDVVIINGNIGCLKRSMFFAETLCNKYPDIPFIFNLGELELYYRVGEKHKNELKNSLKLRKESYHGWPKNLYYSDDPIRIDLKNGQPIDVLCVYGFPKIKKYTGDWKNSHWHKHYVEDVVWLDDPSSYPEKPQETSNVCHGELPIWASIEWINQMHEVEYKKIKTWELDAGVKKILVTHINPYNDSRLKDISNSPYLIHLNKGVWITSNTQCNGVNFLGSNLYSNPGSGTIARSTVFTVKN